MNRWLISALGSSLLCGVSALALHWHAAAEHTSTPRRQAGPASMAEVVARADGLHLHWVGDPPGREPASVLVVSEQPVLLDHRADLRMHYPDFRPWRGVVKVFADGREWFESNFDPAHAERFALWGDMMVYGDPEVTAKLVGNSR